MADLHFESELAAGRRALFLLDARIAAARRELARLNRGAEDGERRVLSRYEARLLRANEHLVLSAIDAREDAEAAARLNQRDGLTGIPNRGLTLDRLETALAAARRNTHRLAVLFVDLDAFKSINDTHGHAAGDRALQSAARRLTASVRESDTVGRLGGDEFLAILPDIDGPADVTRVVAKMVAALATQAAGADDAPPLAASIGIAIYPEDALWGSELIGLADRAMYRAKGRGPGLVEFHDAEQAIPAAAIAQPVGDRPADLRDANEHLVLAALDSQKLQAQGEELHQQQVQFLAMVAHELRNPLDPIITAAELLQHASADNGLLVQVQAVLKRQVSHLTRIIDDLLDGARAGNGKFRLDCRLVFLSDVLGPVIEGIRPRMAQRNQTFSASLSPVPMPVWADPVRLAQVFGNLLDNASKYTAHGGTIALDVRGDAGAATLCVTDTGIGIAALALPHIFDLFVQESHARAHDGQGLGVGLAVARELVRAHGGTISAASAGHGAGSQFVVKLPLLSAAAAVIA